MNFPILPTTKYINIVEDRYRFGHFPSKSFFVVMWLKITAVSHVFYEIIINPANFLEKIFWYKIYLQTLYQTCCKFITFPSYLGNNTTYHKFHIQWSSFNVATCKFIHCCLMFCSSCDRKLKNKKTKHTSSFA